MNLFVAQFTIFSIQGLLNSRLKNVQSKNGNESGSSEHVLQIKLLTDAKAFVLFDRRGNLTTHQMQSREINKKSFRFVKLFQIIDTNWPTFVDTKNPNLQLFEFWCGIFEICQGLREMQKTLSSFTDQSRTFFQILVTARISRGVW